MMHFVFEGYLGKDPTMRYTKDGTPVANLDVASTRRFKTREGDVAEKTTWARVTCWGKLAEIANQYGAKGRHVLITGEEMDASAWIPRNEDGSPKLGENGNVDPRATLELRASTIRFLDKKADGPAADDSFNDEENVPF